MNADAVPFVFVAGAIIGMLGGLVRYFYRLQKRLRSFITHDLAVGTILGALTPMLMVAAPVIAFSAGFNWPDVAQAIGKWGYTRLQDQLSESQKI